MKTIVKKISAAAMAFALLGTGAAVTTSISNTTGKSFGIEANAADSWSYYTTCKKISINGCVYSGRSVSVYRNSAWTKFKISIDGRPAIIANIPSVTIYY
jgi:hypothetical protein